MAKRTLQELNLLDDFLFNAVLSYPEIGEIASATVYDVEPNMNSDIADVKALPKRVRFYHALIDSKSLQSGAEYQKLKNVIVILITPYDPFGYNQKIYTISNKIMELPNAQYEDGAKTIFLNTRGLEGEISEELQQLLRYMEKTTQENAQSETLKKIHQMVEKVKNDEEVTIEFMKIFEREQMLIKKGIEQGRKVEMANTKKECAEKLKERQRAEEAEREIERLKKKLQKLQAQKL